MTTDTSTIPDGFENYITPTLGYDIHSIEGGKGLPQKIVLIHGAWGSRRYLVPTAIELAKSMNVFVPEMPGHGSSSKPKHALTVQQQAHVLFMWFRQKGLKDVHIFGNSYGCQVAAQLVAEHPELAATLTLTDPTVDPKARSMIQTAYRLYMDGFGEPKHSQGQLWADLSDMGPVLAFETVQRMLADDIRPKLGLIKCRTLVVRGEKDPITPQSWGEEVARLIPHAEFSVIPNAPHCVNYATPVQLTNIMLNFISEPSA